ncbi:MAG TPA: hypothetical protein VGW37_15785 [Terriglobia bacterium]|nr:hypothetical protein [Terriglobia bacterium]
MKNASKADLLHSTDGKSAAMSISTIRFVLVLSLLAFISTLGCGGGSSPSSVAPITSTITWAAPAVITCGTALSSTQLNATASVAGSLSYSPAAGAILSAGTQTLTLTFMPTVQGGKLDLKLEPKLVTVISVQQ